MNEIRKIIGVFDQPENTKKGIAFPSVRVWIRGPNEYQTTNLQKCFPLKGNVFLHISAAGNQHPQRNQVGLFSCEASPGQTAEWKVLATLQNLARVIEPPSQNGELRQLAMWQWLVTYRDKPTCTLLAGQSRVYVRRKKGELIGPLTVTPESKLVAHEPVFLFEGVDSFVVDVNKRGCCLIDTDLLPQGKPLIFDPRDAIHRRLKLAQQISQIDWLSRSKTQELSSVLASINVKDGSEWVMEDLPRVLEEITPGGRVDEFLVAAVLQVKAVSDAMEASWKLKNADSTKRAEEEIDRLRQVGSQVRLDVDGVNAKLGNLRQEKSVLENALSDLNHEIEKAKAEAQTAFDAELKRLAQSPASLALLGAWTGAGKKSEHASVRVRTQSQNPDRERVANLQVAICSNLKACGLLPNSATEVATVCIAALAAGQPISFRSPLSGLLAEAVAGALVHPLSLCVDVPAGILDPIDWEALVPVDQREFPMIIQGANRSDIALVLGSLRLSILRQALGYEKHSNTVLLTLESNLEMQVESDFDFGPLIDDRILRFNGLKATSTTCVFADHSKNLPEIVLVSAEEFAEMGDDMLRLPLFATSAQQIVYRRSYAALQKLCDPKDVLRFFFKYWCLPRLSLTDLTSILETKKAVWSHDVSLTELAKSLV